MGGPPDVATAAAHKAYTAEKYTAWVRLAVIAFGVTAYWTLWYPRGDPQIAGLVSVVAGVYGVYDVVGQPFRHFPALKTSMWTAATDATLITIWLLGTGSASSPFYPLWYVSIVAVAFRYNWWATVLATVVYVALYAGLVAATGGFPEHAVVMVMRCGYLLLLGALGAVLAYASTRVFEERFRLAQRLAAAEEREQTLKAENEVRRLEEVNAFKTEFINSAAHELNTPLTPLVLQTHMLRRADNDADRERIVEVLQRNIGRLSNLVQDMLDVARLQSGRLRIEPVPTDLVALVRDALGSFQAAARAAGVELEAQLDETLPCQADRRRIGQVLDNLLSNALKFTPAGGHVNVRATRRGDELVVEVRDSGIGFTPEQGRQLFQPFTRVHQNDIEKPGTGLGLYICRGILENHGGQVEASSPGPGFGATFTIRFPAEAHKPHAG